MVPLLYDKSFLTRKQSRVHPYNYSQNLSEFSENVGFAGVVVDHVRHTLYQNGVRVSVNYLLSGGFANSWFISFFVPFYFI